MVHIESAKQILKMKPRVTGSMLTGSMLTALGYMFGKDRFICISYGSLIKILRTINVTEL